MCQVACTCSQMGPAMAIELKLGWSRLAEMDAIKECSAVFDLRFDAINHRPLRLSPLVVGLADE